jgi:hypothetical protein
MSSAYRDSCTSSIPVYSPFTCRYVQLIYDKGAKIYKGENTAISTNVAGKTRHLHTENWN